MPHKSSLAPYPFGKSVCMPAGLIWCRTDLQNGETSGLCGVGEQRRELLCSELIGIELMEGWREARPTFFWHWLATTSLCLNGNLEELSLKTGEGENSSPRFSFYGS